MTMPLRNFDDLDRARFTWPEPFIIELIRDEYADLLPTSDQMPAAKLHAQILRDAIESRKDGAALRGELMARCGLDAEAVRRVDRAVFFELMRLIGTRFKNSPDLREACGRRLYEALASVIAQQAESEPPALRFPVRGASQRREVFVSG